MKYRTSKKAVNAGYGTRIEVGYAELQFLLKYKDPVAYTTRVEGWGADIYDFGNVAIVTGYSPFGNFRPGYEICRRYDKAAEKACEACRAMYLPDGAGTYDWQKYRDACEARCRELTDKFINKCLAMKWNKAEDDGGL